ncbi:MAG: protein kinase domain-containing protein [Alphaproteobacteria bacterium]
MNEKARTFYNAIYADGHFEKIELGPLVNRGGAAGKIFLNATNPKTVAKVFHDKQKSSSNRKKLEAMLHNPPVFPPAVKDEVEYVQIAWPIAILEDEMSFCVGYLMPLIDMKKAVSLDHLMQKAIRKKLSLPEKYAYRIFAAYNVASMVYALHKAGHYVVDLKPSNIYVYKETMMVAMLDCDGFSIKGEYNDRHVAEFVSEEYIYPEGMNQSCAEMGEEQDKFALAVIIFRLLNGGIHPYSGTPRKTDAKMLTIQERIEEFHYAYGLWPDTYQAPHPYSIHEYFDKKTLEFFERAFTKNQKRPDAKEWKEHIWELLHNLKTCKKDYNHVYFSSKGCGLCIVEEKFKENITNIQKKIDAPQTLRGVEVSELSTENVQKNKIEQIIKDNKIQNFAIGGISAFMIFFTFFYKITDLFQKEIQSCGLAFQFLFVTIIMILINRLIKKISPFVNILQNRALTEMLQIYALVCMLIAMIWINDFPNEIFALTF